MSKGLEIPKDLKPKARKAAEAIVRVLAENEATNTGGCRAFYSPDEWSDRGEDYGTGSVLVVVHDGGDHAAFFNYAYEQPGLMEKVQEALRPLGLYVEQCTGWYSAVYGV